LRSAKVGSSQLRDCVEFAKIKPKGEIRGRKVMQTKQLIAIGERASRTQS
jgi:hypothetical protein